MFVVHAPAVHAEAQQHNRQRVYLESTIKQESDAASQHTHTDRCGEFRSLKPVGLAALDDPSVQDGAPPPAPGLPVSDPLRSHFLHRGRCGETPRSHRRAPLDHPVCRDPRDRGRRASERAARRKGLRPRSRTSSLVSSSLRTFQVAPRRPNAECHEPPTGGRPAQAPCFTRRHGKWELANGLGGRDGPRRRSSRGWRPRCWGSCPGAREQRLRVSDERA